MRSALLKRIVLNTGALWLSYAKLLPVLSTLNADSVVIDCGANIGDITQRFATTGATVYAFEPDPLAFEVLSNRFRQSANVTCIAKGVWDRNDRVPLFAHRDRRGRELPFTVASSIRADKSNVSTDLGTTIDVIDLVEFVQTLGRRVNVIKLDVEGAETGILSKVLRTRCDALFDVMYVETHESRIPGQREELEPLRRRMRELGVRNIRLNWL